MGIEATGVEGIGSGVPPEIAVIMDGGANFVARLVAMEKAKKENEAALADLRLGQSARSALDSAKQKEAEAADLLEKAKVEAEAIVAEAQAKADKMLSKSESALEKAKDEAERIKKDAEQFVAEARSSAQFKLDAAEAERAKQESLNQSLMDAEAQAKKVIKLSEKDREEARRSLEDFNNRISVLKAAIQSVSG